MSEGDLPFSGIDHLILLAEMADHEMDEEMAREIRGAHQLVNEIAAKNADQSWGALYFADCKKRALVAVRAMGDVDPNDARAVFEIKSVLSEYRRVAEFRSELLKRASSAQRELTGGEIYDEGTGEFDGEVAEGNG